MQTNRNSTNFEDLDSQVYCQECGNLIEYFPGFVVRDLIAIDDLLEDDEELGEILCSECEPEVLVDEREFYRSIFGSYY